jgi:hypothetical protein
LIYFAPRRTATQARHKTHNKSASLIDTDNNGTIDQAEINAHKVLMADKDGDSTIDKKKIQHKEIA